MQQAFTYPAVSSFAETNPNLTVFIAYEDFETGKQAKKTCDFLAENLRENCRLSEKMWNFEVLSIPTLRQVAAKDAAEADIVIISCHGHNELPVEVKAWIELWLAGNSSAIALVALFDSPTLDPQQADSIRHYLAAVASRGQMEFFAQPYNSPNRSKEAPPPPLRVTSALGEGALPALSALAQQDVSIRRWGINE